ncbi:hypothetical protein ACHAXA_001722 [Cyclostephanos tholiformis]|jgi:U2 small nuclear ribonucleoprotein B''|uniref:RRM domain-containing protein n=1 Tax=Cyclostephanos tholiformis TaxID=382380 RepID=A0ABD3SD02_9STRA
MGSDAAIMSGSITAPDSSLAGIGIKPQPNYPPNPTLYLSNIDWSIKRALLKRSLLALFSRHGKVIEVICLRGDGCGGKPLRGQAWVIFESLSAATAAIQAERGFVFFGRPLMVNYAKEVSDRIAKRDGTYTAKTKRAAKRKTEDAGGDIDAARMAKFPSHSGVVTSVHDPSSLAGQNSSTLLPATLSAGDFESAKKAGGIQASSTPSSLLVAKNLPSECNDMMLAMLFRQYSGYKEVKLLGEGLATIEFGTENEATAALNGLNGFKLSTSAVLDLIYGEQ